MYEVNKQFTDDCIALFENYLNNLTRQAMFDLNMQYPEFIYIFRDEESNTVPDQSFSFNHKLLSVGELKVSYIQKFTTDITMSQLRQLETIIE